MSDTGNKLSLPFPIWLALVLGVVLGGGCALMVNVLHPRGGTPVPTPVPTSHNVTPVAPPSPAASLPSSSTGLLYFLAPHEKAEGIYVMTPEGTDRRFLAEAQGDFAVSQNGRRITYVSTDEAIWVMNTDGSQLRQLQPPGHYMTFTPSISPDGATVAFQNHDNSLFRVDANGSGLRRLTAANKDVTIIDMAAKFSPDGRHIAYLRAVAEGNPHFPLIIIDSVGRHEKVSGESGFDGKPQWSFDGRYITTNSIKAGVDDGGFTVYDLDKGTNRQFEKGTEPVFSPTENLLAFHDTHPGKNGVALMRPDGSERHIVKGTDGLGNPRFSPDGRRLLVSAVNDEATTEVDYIMNFDGSGRKELPDGEYFKWVPAPTK